jgi:uncharacterized protein (TIGR01777 family)
MRILVSGASGLIGSALVRRLAAPIEVIRLVRREPTSDAAEIRWDPAAGTIDAHRLEAFDAVVHLAGENIGAGRWTSARKARIRNSRVDGTRMLAQTLAGLARPPKVLVSASAVGFYGNRGDGELDESSSPGEGFLAGVCRDWEAATVPAAEAGIRVVLARFGVVLAREGGALARLLPPFRFGLGGRLGSGRQFMSWVSLEDVVGAIRFLLENESLRGPVNVTSPQPVTNRQFTETLGRVLHRPTVLPAPAFLLRVALGEMADEMLLSSARVLPRRLLDAGYRFSQTDLEATLMRMLE